MTNSFIEAVGRLEAVALSFKHHKYEITETLGMSVKPLTKLISRWEQFGRVASDHFKTGHFIDRNRFKSKKH